MSILWQTLSHLGLNPTTLSPHPRSHIRSQAFTEMVFCVRFHSILLDSVPFPSLIILSALGAIYIILEMVSYEIDDLVKSSVDNCE